MTTAIRFYMPQKRVCLWGAPSQIHEDPQGRATWNVKLRQTGGNTGNLFIGRGLYDSIDAQSVTYDAGELSGPLFDEKYDYVFIPASNFLNPALDLTEVYNYFEKTKAPLVCFGLGSQIIPNEKLVLQPGTERLIRLISERSGSIGVRGAFTASVLNDLGIKNISLTGCPSLLGLDDNTLSVLQDSKPNLARLSVNFSNNVREHSFDENSHRSTESALFKRAIQENSFYVLQNEQPELNLLDLLRDGGSEMSIENTMRSILYNFQIKSDDTKVRNYLRSRLRVLYDVSSWVGMMNTMTASVGTRFHGNIAAILAGTPAMVLVHDMRTLELAELFSIPHVKLDRFYSAEEVVERLLSVDYEPFARRISLLRAEWQAFAYRNGFECSGEKESI